MKKISSSLTVLSKKIFPAFWFGFVGLFLVAGFAFGAYEQSPMFLIMPIFMGLIGFLVMKNLVWDLVDEVYDYGDFLLVKNRSEEDQILFSNIMNVSASTYMNPPRITLRLVNPSKFGSEITFSPVRGVRLNPFAKNEIAEDLILRVHQARSGGGF